MTDLVKYNEHSMAIETTSNEEGSDALQLVVSDVLGNDFQIQSFGVETTSEGVRVQLVCVPRSREAVSNWPRIAAAFRERVNPGVSLDVKLVEGRALSPDSFITRW